MLCLNRNSNRLANLCPRAGSIYMRLALSERLGVRQAEAYLPRGRFGMMSIS